LRKPFAPDSTQTRGMERGGNAEVVLEVAIFLPLAANTFDGDLGKSPTLKLGFKLDPFVFDRESEAVDDDVDKIRDDGDSVLNFLLFSLVFFLGCASSARLIVNLGLLMGFRALVLGGETFANTRGVNSRFHSIPVMFGGDLDISACFRRVAGDPGSTCFRRVVGDDVTSVCFRLTEGEPTSVCFRLADGDPTSLTTAPLAFSFGFFLVAESFLFPSRNGWPRVGGFLIFAELLVLLLVLLLFKNGCGR